MIARARTIAPDAPNPCKLRAAIKASIPGATAQASVAAQNTRSAVISTGLRP